MGNELAVKSPTGTLTVQTMDDLARLGNMLASSGYFKDARDAAQAGVKVLAGLEMGFGAFASMTGIHLIDGKPSVGANLLAQAVKRSGRYNYRVTKHTAEECVIAFFEGGEPIGESSFSMKEAAQAGVAGRGPWKSYPKAMLFARALSQGVRWHCPDVLGGTTAYVPEELGANVDGDGNVITVPSQPKPAPAAALEEDEDPFEAPVASKPKAKESAEDDGGEFPPDPPEGLFDDLPRVSSPQLKALHTRLTKLGFNGKKEDKDLARDFISHMVKRELASSKDLTRDEAHEILGLEDGELARKLDEFKADRQLEAESVS